MTSKVNFLDHLHKNNSQDKVMKLKKYAALIPVILDMYVALLSDNVVHFFFMMSCKVIDDNAA
jgi:hypothetical protein